MQPADYFLLAVIAFLLFFAARSCWRRRGRSCAGCDGCCNRSACSACLYEKEPFEASKGKVK